MAHWGNTKQHVPLGMSELSQNSSSSSVTDNWSNTAAVSWFALSSIYIHNIILWLHREAWFEEKNNNLLFEWDLLVFWWSHDVEFKDTGGRWSLTISDLTCN